MRAEALAAILLAACGVETYRQARPSAEVAIRFVADDVTRAGETLPRWGEGEPIAVGGADVVGAEHIEHVQLYETGEGRRLIVLDLSEIGRTRLREATTERVGARLAIVVAGRVVATPTLREPLTEGEAFVRVDPEHVEAIFAAMTEEPAAH
jgi:preprotein translocase subunit SecD